MPAGKAALALEGDWALHDPIHSVSPGMGTHNSKLKNKNQRGEKGNKKSLKSHPAHAGYEPLLPF